MCIRDRAHGGLAEGLGLVVHELVPAAVGLVDLEGREALDALEEHGAEVEMCIRDRDKIISLFSEGNVEEVEKGLFVTGETIEELADNLAAQLPVEVLRPNAPTTFQENLLATVEKLSLIHI